ncbi:hypothetical protein H9I84_002435 [Escherichia coli]|nr:hypothetical protein [Escherichia coli]
MMSLWDALRMNMMISYQELVRTFPKKVKADVYTSSDRNEERTYLQEQHDLAIKRRDEKREKRLESGE